MCFKETFPFPVKFDAGFIAKDLYFLWELISNLLQKVASFMQGLLLEDVEKGCSECFTRGKSGSLFSIFMGIEVWTRDKNKNQAFQPQWNTVFQME